MNADHVQVVRAWYIKPGPREAPIVHTRVTVHPRTAGQNRVTADNAVGNGIAAFAIVNEVRAKSRRHHVAQGTGRIQAKTIADIKLLQRDDVRFEPLQNIQTGSFISLIVAGSQVLPKAGRTVTFYFNIAAEWQRRGANKKAANDSGKWNKFGLHR